MASNYMGTPCIFKALTWIWLSKLKGPALPKERCIKRWRKFPLKKSDLRKTFSTIEAHHSNLCSAIVMGMPFPTKQAGLTIISIARCSWAKKGPANEHQIWSNSTTRWSTQHRQQHAMFAGVGTTRCASSGPISAPIVGSGGGSWGVTDGSQGEPSQL